MRPLVGEPVLSIIMVTLGLASVRGGPPVWSGLRRAAIPVSVSSGPSSRVRRGHQSGGDIYHSGHGNLLVVFLVFFKYSNSGIAMRATAEDAKAVF